MRWGGQQYGAYLLNMMKVLKSEVVGDKGFGWGGRKRGKKEEEEVGGLFARELGRLSLSGAVLPMVP
jgi:hypothetical protein